MARRWEKRIEVADHVVTARGAHRRHGWEVAREVLIHGSAANWLAFTPKQARAVALALTVMADEVDAQPETDDTAEVAR